MRYVCNRWWLVLRFGCFIEPRTKRVDSGVQSQLFWSLLCSVFLRIMVVKVAGWLLPVICRCRCQNAGYASFIKFVYHRRGNVQNAAIFQSQQLMNRGIYIYIQTQLQQHNKCHIRTCKWSGRSPEQNLRTNPVVWFASDKPDRVLVEIIKKMRCPEV